MRLPNWEGKRRAMSVYTSKTVARLQDCSNPKVKVKEVQLDSENGRHHLQEPALPKLIARSQIQRAPLS